MTVPVDFIDGNGKSRTLDFPDEHTALIFVDGLRYREGTSFESIGSHPWD